MRGGALLVLPVDDGRREAEAVVGQGRPYLVAHACSSAMLILDAGQQGDAAALQLPGQAREPACRKSQLGQDEVVRVPGLRDELIDQLIETGIAAKVRIRLVGDRKSTRLNS